MLATCALLFSLAILEAIHEPLCTTAWQVVGECPRLGVGDSSEVTVLPALASRLWLWLKSCCTLAQDVSTQCQIRGSAEPSSVKAKSQHQVIYVFVEPRTVASLLSISLYNHVYPIASAHRRSPIVLAMLFTMIGWSRGASDEVSSLKMRTCTTTAGFPSPPRKRNRPASKDSETVRHNTTRLAMLPSNNLGEKRMLRSLLYGRVLERQRAAAIHAITDSRQRVSLSAVRRWRRDT
ncbi:hypothetical protein BU15DRAFT_66291 [Melanogaster broomeanus]|nr:hypothetical protein BU15DRAFT_66291 [Melanogaster broomeanus]